MNPALIGGAALDGFVLSGWLFVKLIALIYAIAFLSFGVQARGLIGTGGILPVGDYVARMQQVLGRRAFWNSPTLFFLNASDTAILMVVILGVACACLLFLGVLPHLMLLMLFGLYLSLVNGGQVFMSYQWDALLLETGFLTLFFSPTSPLALWLLWWLLFRLMLLSGTVKLLSGDRCWRDLTALYYHYQTQPLPTALAWYAHRLPNWFQRFSVAVMYVIEVALPFLIFAPPPWRYVALCGFMLLQGLIVATGNYTFFNLLTLALIVLLIDDGLWACLLPADAMSLVAEGVAAVGLSWPLSLWSGSWSGAVLMGIGLGVGVPYVVLSFLQMALVFYPRAVPNAVRIVLRALMPFHVINNYGLFAVMTRRRPEIILEGSDDGETWHAYEFRYKPGDLKRRPRWVQPHQPRLDWQMWFAALKRYQENPWFLNFVVRLLQGSPEVLRLLARNPFPEQPPTYIRAVLYNYTFSNWSTRRSTGAWWVREPAGLYLPTVSRNVFD